MDTRFRGTINTTENLSLVNKKSALEGSISMGSVSEEVPVTRNQKKIRVTTGGEIKTSLRKNKGS